jgi:hypothetical protein
MSKRVRDWYGTNPESFFDVYTWVTTKMVICQVYTWYIPCIYLLNVYDRDIPCINMEYYKNIPRIWYIPGIYQVYVSLIPGGWCCGGGHGPIPPDPPAITSPGLVREAAPHSMLCSCLAAELCKRMRSDSGQQQVPVVERHLKCSIGYCSCSAMKLTKSILPL